MDPTNIAEMVQKIVEEKLAGVLESLQATGSVTSTVAKTPIRSDDGLYLAPEFQASRVERVAKPKQRKKFREGTSSSEDQEDKRFASSSESEDDAPGKKRYSALRNVIAPRQIEARQIVSVQQEAYKGVKLERLTVSNVLKFIDDVNRYQAQWEVRLNAATYVVDSVKRILIAKSRGRLTEGRFYQITSKELLREVPRAVKPQSVLAFSKAFEDNISFSIPENYVPSAVNLEVLYDSLLLYRERVSLVFEFCQNTMQIMFLCAMIKRVD